MSAASHTPGPWQVADTHPHWPKRCVVDCDGQTKPFTLIAEATEASARLIAAASELLEALEQMLAETELTYPTQLMDRQDAARRAIAKARGAA